MLSTLLLIGALIIIGVPVLAKLYYFTIQGRNKHFPDMQKKVVIVTGGTAGIGKETARLLYQLNATVIITGRDKNKAEAFFESLPMHTPQRPKMKFYQVDFKDLDQVKQFAETIKSKYKKIDVLVNNAGMMSPEHRLSEEGVELTMTVNHLAGVYLTSLLMDLLVKGGHQARVVNVSSDGQLLFKKLFKEQLESRDLWQIKIENRKVKYDAQGTYGLTKLCNVIFSRELAELIQSRGWNMKTASLHPGVVYTDAFRNFKSFPMNNAFLRPIFTTLFVFFLKTEAQGAATSLHLALCPFDEIQNGGYYGDCKVSDQINSEALQEHGKFIWEETLKVIYEKTGHLCFREK